MERWKERGDNKMNCMLNSVRDWGNSPFLSISIGCAVVIKVSLTDTDSWTISLESLFNIRLFFLSILLFLLLCLSFDVIHSFTILTLSFHCLLWIVFSAHFLLFPRDFGKRQMKRGFSVSMEGRKENESAWSRDEEFVISLSYEKERHLTSYVRAFRSTLFYFSSCHSFAYLLIPLCLWQLTKSTREQRMCEKRDSYFSHSSHHFWWRQSDCERKYWGVFHTAIQVKQDGMRTNLPNPPLSFNFNTLSNITLSLLFVAIYITCNPPIFPPTHPVNVVY